MTTSLSFVCRAARRCLSGVAPAASSSPSTPKDTTFLTISDLKSSVQPRELHRLLSAAGPIRSITMNFSPNGDFAGTALVKFHAVEGAQRALEENRRNGTMVNGIQIVLSQASSTFSAPPRHPPQSGLGAMIFINNLCYSTTEDQIRAECSRYGAVDKLDLFMRDGRSLGMAKVLFARRSDADASIQALNNFSFDGRRLFVTIDKEYVSVGDNIKRPGVDTNSSPLKQSAGSDGSRADGIVRPSTPPSSSNDALAGTPSDGDNNQALQEDYTGDDGDALLRSIEANSQIGRGDAEDDDDDPFAEDNAALDREMELDSSSLKNS